MARAEAPWRTVLTRFARLGVLGFGGPPNHVAMMRRQWVESGDVSAHEFSDAFAAVSLLPGPASTQMAMWLGWRSRGWRGLLAAAALFVVPAVVMVLVLSGLLFGHRHLEALDAAALGAAAVVPAVALRAGVDLARGYRGAHVGRTGWPRLITYGLLGGVTTLLAVSWLPVALLAAGGIEALTRLGPRGRPAALLGLAKTASPLALLAIKVGALSFGGGFVIVPMMRADAVGSQHWMSPAAFGAAVAIGQLTPGPVVATIAAVGYAAGGLGGGLLAAAVAFFPSMVMLGVGARHFSAVRERPGWRAFFDGAGPAATGAIAASAVVLAVGCPNAWQWPIVAAAVALVLAWRRPPTAVIAAGALCGLVLGLVAHVSTW